MGDARFDVAQVNNEMLILRDDPGFDLSGYAEVVVIVNGKKPNTTFFYRKPNPPIARCYRIANVNVFAVLLKFARASRNGLR